MTITYEEQYYTEAYKIILSKGEKYIKRIPKIVLDNIKEKVNLEYNFNYNPELSFKEQNIKKEAVALIVALKIQYWCDTEEERKMYKQKLVENQERHEKEKAEKYSYENLFKANKKEENKDTVQNIEQINIQEETSLQNYKENVIIKIVRKIKECFINIFKRR